MKTMRLGDLCKIRHGKDWKQLDTGDVPVYGSGGFMGRHVNKYSYNKPTVMLPRKGTITNVFYLDEPFWNVDTVFYTEIDTTKLLPKYLFYHMKTVDLGALDSGSGRPSLTQSALNEISIVVPNLEDQKKIVAKLDKGLSQIAKAEGLLRQNIANVEDLQKSILAETFRFDDNTRAHRLGDLCLVFVDGDWIESKDQSPSGIRLIQTGNVGIGIFRNKSEKKRFVSNDTFNRLRCTEVFPDDLLVSRLPEPVGRACIMPDIKERMITAVDCTIIRTKPECVSAKYLLYFMTSDEYFCDIEKNCTGSTRKRISRKNLGNIQVPVSERSVQEEIVIKLDREFAKIKKLQELYVGELAKVTDLRQSILAEAFMVT